MTANTYLGESPYDLTQDPIYSKYTPGDWALLWIFKYDGFDGAHHKDWVLDQVARILNGAPVTAVKASWTDHPDELRFSVGTSEQYDQWVALCRGDKDTATGEYEYDHSVGIPP